MKKLSKTFLIIILMLMTFILFNNKVMAATPQCKNPGDFYHMSYGWEDYNTVQDGEITPCVKGLCARYYVSALDKSFWSATGNKVWYSLSTKSVAARLKVNKKSTIKNVKITFVEQASDYSEKEACYFTVIPSDVKPGKDKSLVLTLGPNVFEANSASRTASDPKATYVYGHIYKIKFDGQYIDEDGKTQNFNSDSISVSRRGQKYSTGRTVVDTTKKTESLSDDESGGMDITDVISNETDNDVTVPVGTKQKIINPSSEGIACDDISDLINKYWGWIVIAGPIALIVLLSIDFTGAVISSDDEALKKAGKKAVKRTITVVLLLFLPFILTTLLKWFGIEICI